MIDQNSHKHSALFLFEQTIRNKK